jgi:hypothetical protein
MRIFLIKSSILSTIVLCFGICVIFYVVAIVALAVTEKLPVFFVLLLMNCGPHVVLILTFFLKNRYSQNIFYLLSI